MSIQRGSVLAALVLMAGCTGTPDLEEPELGLVKGRVTLDGAPAAGVQVTFIPQGSANADPSNVGAVSSAITDADGNYELLYKDDVPGAAVGTHLIQIMRDEGVRPDEDGNVTAAPTGPPIPVQWGMASQETREVASGENEINFDLFSDQ